MQAMGIDMGTTTVSLIMVDGESGELLGSRTIAHQASLAGAHPFARIQDPGKLWGLTEQAAAELMKEYGPADSIGLTGQMHGVLYTDRKGEAVSPLYTWQDGSGNETAPGGRTYAEILGAAAGPAASGYGMTTHFYLWKTGGIPREAKKITALSDYIAMKLCGRQSPVVSKDMAASWGCFDLEKGDFRRAELEAVGVELSYLPEILPGHGIMGTTACSLPPGIPVAVSLGDNQASVLGSVRDLADTVLVNIGTGSQVSFGIGNYLRTEGAIELRPCTEEFYLMAGSGLCGGRAYAMLEEFYRSASGTEGEPLYGRMESQAREFLAKYGSGAAWKIRTTFSGTRSSPGERGSIQGIGVENFRPGAMTAGLLMGILEELHEMYREMCRMAGTKAGRLVGSGNGIRKNLLMRELAQERFEMHMDIPVCREEAAYGAALQSLFAAGFAGSMEELQQKIRYLK